MLLSWLLPVPVLLDDNEEVLFFLEDDDFLDLRVLVAIGWEAEVSQPTKAENIALMVLDACVGLTKDCLVEVVAVGWGWGDLRMPWLSLWWVVKPTTARSDLLLFRLMSFSSATTPLVVMQVGIVGDMGDESRLDDFL